MELDTNRSLGEIQGDATHLVDQMCQIQHHTRSREEAMRWLQSLRFLSIAKMRTLKPGVKYLPGICLPEKDGADDASDLPTRILRLTDQSEDDGEISYLALSYRWGKEELGGYKYLIETSTGCRPNRVSSLILDRVIRFAQAKRLKYIWIDQECLNIDDPDHCIGIQAMDLVYRNAGRSVAVLNTTIDKVEDLQGLTSLYREYEGPRKSFGSQEDVSKIISAVKLMASDEWWERTWTFQEELCASRNMHFLIRLAPSLAKLYKGEIPGEFEILPMDVRQRATEFCLWCETAGYSFDPAIALRLKQYNRLNQTKFFSETKSPLFSGLSPVIYADINARENEQVGDRLAIIANCRKYSTRLDALSLITEGYGLSASILTLYFSNGEIFENEPASPALSLPPGEDLLSLTVHQLITRISFRKFEPPGPSYHASFTDHCRLPDVSLGPTGVSTTGWLWELGDVLSLSSLPLTNIPSGARRQPSHAKRLRDFRTYLLDVVVRDLHASRQHTLATLLHKFLNNNNHGDDNEQQQVVGRERDTMWFREKMLEGLMEEVHRGGTLRLAHLVGQHEYRAIFVGRSSRPSGGGDLDGKLGDEEPRATLAFTSWARATDEGLARFVSLEVAEEEANDNNEVEDYVPRLFPKSWVNGLWFAVGDRDRVVFPWPFCAGRRRDMSL